MRLGVVESIEVNKVKTTEARRKTGSFAIRVKAANSSIMFGRHFDMEDQIVSLLTRKSIDLLKEHFRSIMTKDDWNLVRKLKPHFGID